MMENIFSGIGLLGLGFFLGIQHALDADHVVAVSTIVSETKSLKRSSWMGLVWGMGHTVTLVLLGAVLLFFRLSVSPSLAQLLEALVGVMLVFLGGRVIWNIGQGRLHRHEHEHEGKKHAHWHSHALSPHHQHLHRSFLVGMLHGLAGSAALTLLLVTTVGSFWQGMLFLTVFGLGSAGGMLVMSSLIALPFLLFERSAFLHKMLQGATGLVSIGLGIGIIFSFFS